MARVLITDQNYEDLALERELFGNAGAELVVAQCTTEDEVLALEFEGIEQARPAPGVLDALRG